MRQVKYHHLIKKSYASHLCIFFWLFKCWWRLAVFWLAISIHSIHVTQNASCSARSKINLQVVKNLIICIQHEAFFQPILSSIELPCTPVPIIWCWIPIGFWQRIVLQPLEGILMYFLNFLVLTDSITMNTFISFKC